MATADHRVYRYRVDRSDRLSAVDDAWLDFARDNQAAELTREHVLGEPLWQFISGHETRQIYQLLLERIRAGGGPISVPFRCDSPDRFRFMQLDLRAGERGSVEFTGILERDLARHHTAILERLRTNARYTFPICSFCRRIFAFGEWLELEQAVARLRLLESEDPPGIEEDVCTSCQEKCLALADASAL